MTHFMRILSVATLAMSLMMPSQVATQTPIWPNLDQVIFPHLTRTGTAEASFFLPDNADPALAQRALGVVYEYIEGSAGSTSIEVGVFVKSDAAWVFAGRVQNLFGQSPREAAFTGNTVELTTTMLGPNEPRCCPTLPVRWRIDLATLTAQRQN